MFSRLSDILYITIKKNRLLVANVKNGKHFDDVPVLALQQTAKGAAIEAVGRDAIQAKTANDNLQLKNGFKHERVVIGDFSIAEKTLSHFIRELDNTAIFRSRPIVIMHPLDDYVGGLSSIEVKALKELAIGAGARKAYVWQGRKLTDHEIVSGTFPESGWLEGMPDWIQSGK